MNNTERDEDRLRAPLVAIDGAAARRIREEKKLTQLYVASVVGVTTDTISRWENNRYPAIRRDNAEKLATALEVELEAIIQPEAPASTTPPRRRRPIIIAILTACILLIAFTLFQLLAPAPAVIRWLPPHAAPGQVIPVTLHLAEGKRFAGGIILRERLPEGWEFVAAKPTPKGIDLTHREIRWLLADEGQSVINYTVRIPVTASIASSATVSGSATSAGNGSPRQEEIAGQSQLVIKPLHWADSDGDGRIDDREIIPAYHLSEEMGGLGLDWQWIEKIWSGSGYQWDEKGKVFQVKP